MNILYISFLNGDSWAGPTYSVPKQIAAQSKIDNVFWYNIRDTKIKEWKELPYYHDLTDCKSGKIADLPFPFNSPDIIVVEQFYGFAGKRILYEIIKSRIPYVIIPRGELTKSAQKRKAWKKTIANAILFKKFSNCAAAIEYLTDQERIDSGVSWNKTNFVIPNGILMPANVKTESCISRIQCISIGRIEPYHKGLDILIKACGSIADKLREAYCYISIYGPDYDGKVIELQEMIKKYKIEDIVSIHDGIYGEKKQQILLNSDVFLITSRFEGHPMALIEALSYGIPAIATTGSNMRREIEEYNAGWGADNHISSVAAAFLSMINEKNNLKEKGINALRLSSNYEWSKIAQCTHNEYEKLLSKRGENKVEKICNNENAESK